MCDGSESGPAGWLWLPFLSSQGIGNGTDGPSGSIWAVLPTPCAEACQLGASNAPPAALVARKLLGRDYRWVVGRNLRDEARIDIQRLGDHVSWAVRQPIRQIHLLKPIRLEDLHVHKIRVPNILDIVTERLLDVADVAGMEVCGHRLRPGVEDGYASFSLHPVIPFVAIGMPMHLS